VGGAQSFTPVVRSNILPDIISCTGPSFCLGLTFYGYFWTFKGVAWSHETRTGWPSFFDPAAVSCATARFCVAVGSGEPGQVYLRRGRLGRFRR